MYFVKDKVLMYISNFKTCYGYEGNQTYFICLQVVLYYLKGVLKPVKFLVYNHYQIEANPAKVKQCRVKETFSYLKTSLYALKKLKVILKCFISFIHEDEKK